ncbi:MAG: Cof-type HAD-IIB family hydrolase [Synergistaceae bacterium]|jgi:HAD superfamily hydrolase (TIGR01484 family)|nr:Cof-type HAD-IIB family hydrolase [Synergistaceae bacterium]
MNKKLVFFDIDGTLVSHAGGSHVPEPTAEAVERLKQNGHTLAIATARNLALTRKTAAFFGIDLLVCSNGAYVARADGAHETCLHERLLSGEFVKVFRAEAFSLKSYALDTENVYTEMDEDYFEAFLVEQAGRDCRKSTAAAEGLQLACIFSPLPLRWCGHEGVDVVKTPRYTEFRPSGVSKWSGVVTAAEAAGFELQDVVTVGDGLNDIEMVRNASLGLAVGGANAELKKAADLVTGDIDEGGILSAFRKLGLI